MNTYKESQLIAALDAIDEFLKLADPIKEIVTKFDRTPLNKRLETALEKVSPLIVYNCEKSSVDPTRKYISIRFRANEVQGTHKRSVYGGQFIDLSRILNLYYMSSTVKGGAATVNIDAVPWRLVLDNKILAESWCKAIFLQEIKWKEERERLAQEVNRPESVDEIIGSYREACQEVRYILEDLSSTARSIFEDEIISC